MKKFNRKIFLQNLSGIALPTTVIVLLVLSILGVSLVTRFSSTGADEFVRAKIENQFYSTAYSGLKRAEYHLKRPDDPGEAHIWTEDHSESFTLSMSGRDVDVQIEDVYLSVE